MIALVTGVGGFVGSSLADRLLSDGWSVRGIDVFSPYYDPGDKRANLAGALGHPSFSLVEADLNRTDLAELLDGVDVVFHQAGQPGVRLSWAGGFHEYVVANVEATQRLLEAARYSSIDRFVFASSSSVYGNVVSCPTDETQPTAPFSPYGVTKLAAEHLCRAYAQNFGLPTVSLRYFTVYGPRQRPDMAIHRLINSALDRVPFDVFGDGSQIRDFTYVGDVVEANLKAATADVAAGAVVNIAGGASTTLAALIDLVGVDVGTPVPVERQAAQSGDVFQTGGSIELAARLLGWEPKVDLRSGVAAQVEWHRAQRAFRS